MHHTKMVRDMVAGLQEVLHQKKSLNKNPKIITEPVNNVANVVQVNQQQLDANDADSL